MLCWRIILRLFNCVTAAIRVTEGRMRLAGLMLVCPAYVILFVCLTRRTPCRFLFAADCSFEDFRSNLIEVFHFPHSYSKREYRTNYISHYYWSFLYLMTFSQILWHWDGRWLDWNVCNRKSSVLVPAADLVRSLFYFMLRYFCGLYLVCKCWNVTLVPLLPTGLYPAGTGRPVFWEGVSASVPTLPEEPG